MSPEAKLKIQLALAVTIAVVGIRAGYIVYERYSERAADAAEASRKAAPLNPDDYVVPKKLYPTDLKSAKQLAQQPVWVREGYQHTYYPYDLVRHRTDFSHEAGLLLPIQKLEIKDVVTDSAPHSAHLQQVMAVFEQDGKPTQFPSARSTAAVTASTPTTYFLSRIRMNCTNTGRRISGLQSISTRSSPG